MDLVLNDRESFMGSARWPFCSDEYQREHWSRYFDVSDVRVCANYLRAIGVTTTLLGLSIEDDFVAFTGSLEFGLSFLPNLYRLAVDRLRN